MSLVNNQTYTGKFAQDFYSAAFLASNTIANVQLIPNVKNSIKLNRLDVANIVQPADCSFSDGGTTTLSTNTISVCDFKINLQYCIKDFEAMWISEKMRAGALNSNIPDDFMTYLLGQVAGATGQKIEQMVWTASTAASPTPDECDGFLRKLLADGSVVDVAAVGGGLSASNIIAEITKVYNAVPEAVKNSTKMRLYVGTAAASFYKLATANVSTGSGAYYVGDRPLDWLGIPMVVCPGIGSNKIVAAEYDALVVATDLESDFSDVRVINMMETTGEPNVRVVGGFKIGMGHKVGSEIVLYS